MPCACMYSAYRTTEYMSGARSSSALTCLGEPRADQILYAYSRSNASRVLVAPLHVEIPGLRTKFGERCASMVGGVAIQTLDVFSWFSRCLRNNLPVPAEPLLLLSHFSITSVRTEGGIIVIHPTITL